MKSQNILKQVILLSAFIVLLGGGCDILNPEPQQAISTEIALGNTDGIKGVLGGAYNYLDDYYVYGGQMYMLPDLMGAGKEVQWTGTYSQPGQIYRKEITVDNSYIENPWVNAYRVINSVNNVLASLDSVEDENDKKRYEGEAKFLRAITYFQLVRLYGKDYNDGNPDTNLGVPLILKPTEAISEEDERPRDSVKKVYTQVIDDLKDAVDLLESHNTSYIYATKYAAQAFLARVYLQQRDYAKARDTANDVIENGPYSLVADFSEAFNKSGNTTEDIFALQVSAQGGTNSLQTFYAAQDEAGRGDIDISNIHLDLYEPNDDRRAFFYQDGNTYRTGKWKNQYGNVQVMRLAEMYLTRAEGNFQEGTEVGAKPHEDISTIRTRVGLNAVASVTLEDILKERHLELAFEGHFLFDAKRTEQSVDGMAWNSNRLIFPIPQREIETNSALQGQQNEDYGS